MGSTNTKTQIEVKTWPQGESHEMRTNPFTRDLAFVSYQRDEKLSLGKADPKIIDSTLNDEFELTEKYGGFVDAERKKYSDRPDCCLTDNNFIFENNVLYTCHPFTKKLTSDFCDQYFIKTCLNENSNHPKCKTWIRSVVEQKRPMFNTLFDLASKEEYYNEELTKIFITALRDFQSPENNFNEYADAILNSYNETIKKEYKCAFSSENIKKQNINTPKECWYKECVLSPTFKLLTENIYKRKLCRLTICDVDIKNLNIGTNEVMIVCNNKFNNFSINIDADEPRKESEVAFFVPTFLNTLFPVLLIFSFLFLKI